MNEKTGEKYPIIHKGKAGYWHAYGNGWAVCAPTQNAVRQKYDEMLLLMNELVSRPMPIFKEAGDILKTTKDKNKLS